MLRWSRVASEDKGPTTYKMKLVEKVCTYKAICKQMIEDLGTLARHIFNADWQYNQYQELRDNLPKDWLLTVMDFAENYRCLQQDQISAAYYSYEQATIHPIQMFYRCQDESCPQPCNQTVSHSVILISDDLKHDCAAVKAFDRIAVGKLGFTPNHTVQYSDNCASQYKSKGPLLNLQENDLSTEKGFFGTRHGKNPCDTLGGVLKNQARRYVIKRKGQIDDAEDLSRFALNEMPVINDRHRKRNFEFVPSDSIDRVQRDIRTYDGTQKLHCFKNITEYGHVYRVHV